MSENNGYTNFNSYEQQQTPPVSPPTTPLYAPQGQAPGYYAVPVQQSEKRASGLGVASILLSLTCCCGGFTSIIALILSIIALKKNKRDITAFLGLLLSLMIVLCMIGMFIWVGLNPETASEFMDAYMQSYNETYNAMLEEGNVYASVIKFFR